MKMKWLVLPLTLFGLSQAAVAGTQPAANQSQPTSSVVTPSSANTAMNNSLVGSSVSFDEHNRFSFTIDGISPQGTLQITFKSGQTTTPATASIQGDIISVQLAGGEIFSFPVKLFSK